MDPLAIFYLGILLTELERKFFPVFPFFPLNFFMLFSILSLLLLLLLLLLLPFFAFFIENWEHQCCSSGGAGSSNEEPESKEYSDYVLCEGAVKGKIMTD